MESLFAPAERVSIGEIHGAFDLLKAQTPYDVVLNLMPGIALIVNRSRQVLFANSATLTGLGLTPEDVLGARPGEILNCVHSKEMPGGCGTSEACWTCGVVNAILEAFDTGKKTAKECRIATSSPGKGANLDILATAVPISTGKDRFVLVSLDDISDSKRRQVLEHLFFHDIMNSIASIQAGISLLGMDAGPDPHNAEYLARLASATENLIDEVRQQRELLTMENGDLEMESAEINLTAFVREIIRNIELGDFSKDNRIDLRDGSPDLMIATDPVLLRRVIGNMLKNALEASAKGDPITLEIGTGGGKAEIAVHNSSFIPRDIQLQVFQRSFSTKGRGRGIGTYSMRMLTVDYLKGEIGFSSDEAEGTRFRILLPLRMDEGL